jgi:alkylhydroperoxidase/carboxymuconolactone decarboxylase family protein YurZ
VDGCGPVPFHVAHAKAAGATREEVISAVLLGLPAAGNQVTQALPAALAAYDEASLDAVKGIRAQSRIGTGRPRG